MAFLLTAGVCGWLVLGQGREVQGVGATARERVLRFDVLDLRVLTAVAMRDTTPQLRPSPARGKGESAVLARRCFDSRRANCT